MSWQGQEHRFLFLRAVAMLRHVLVVQFASNILHVSRGPYRDNISCTTPLGRPIQQRSRSSSSTAHCDADGVIDLDVEFRPKLWTGAFWSYCVVARSPSSNEAVIAVNYTEKHEGRLSGWLRPSAPLHCDTSKAACRLPRPYSYSARIANTNA